MKEFVVTVIILVASVMLIGLGLTLCKGDSEPKEQTEQAQESQVNAPQFHPIFVPNPNGGVQMIPMWY